MGITLTIPVGVVVAREAVDSPWQDHAWRPVEVFLNPPADTTWKELRRGEDFIHYHAATMPLVLHRKETPGYLANLDNEAPSVYVVLRDADIEEESEWPVEVHLVTASPTDIEAYGEGGTEIIARVPLPETLGAAILEFINEHHHAEPFIKRQRNKFAREDEHHFGQEPLVELRDRMAKAKDINGQDKAKGKGPGKDKGKVKDG